MVRNGIAFLTKQLLAPYYQQIGLVMGKPVFWSDYICIKVPFGWQQSLSVVVKETAYKCLSLLIW